MITSDEAESLIILLERNAGANAHTAGKARNYLRQVVKKPNAKFSNCTADEFIQAVKQAAYYGQWKQLDDLMARWW